MLTIPFNQSIHTLVLLKHLLYGLPFQFEFVKLVHIFGLELSEVAVFIFRLENDGRSATGNRIILLVSHSLRVILHFGL